MHSRAVDALYVFAVGAWLAVLQVVLFLSLELLLSSAFLTFLVVVFAWLVGAAVGVWLPPGRSTAILMGISGGAPYAVHGLLFLRPFDTSLVWLHGILVGSTALLAGQFFQQERRSFAGVGTLFFWENNGFTAGLAGAGLAMMLWGRAFLLWGPAVGCVLVMGIARARRRGRSPD